MIFLLTRNEVKEENLNRKNLPYTIGMIVFTHVHGHTHFVDEGIHGHTHSNAEITSALGH